MTSDTLVFDPAREYGIIDAGDLPVLAFELLARSFLPAGTPFKVLEYTPRQGDKQRAWYYSPTGQVPNPDRVCVLKECVA